MSGEIRHNWTRSEVLELLEGSLEGLKERARGLHERYGAQDVQKCQLLSVKTGGCPEDCAYCSQSAHYKTEVSGESMLSVDDVLDTAKVARDQGAARFCMGTAWRKVPEGANFEAVLAMIRGIRELGMEACVTLGMATEAQLQRMQEAGLTAYNHNLDTSRDYYPKIITTRTYDDRLNTLRAVRKAGVQICSGGILGMGESVSDRADMLVELSSFDPHPESVPINLLVPIEGTPLEGVTPIKFEEFLRVVAAARVVMPKTRVRLSAGRNSLSEEQQMECFSVGANSIFVGEKLLTTPNVDTEQDERMVGKLAPAQMAETASI